MSVETQDPFKRITVTEAKKMVDAGLPVIDVREPNEYQAGHVPGAKLVPLNSFLRSPRQHLPANGPVLFICAMGQRSGVASEMAAASGATEVYNIEGGTNDWIAKGYPTEK
ncbi:MAG TPA: rhodanese-like domain-containing protein [Chloroflexota bacterium]|jgi:rhodanese-related sulfurtransferase|nr:rhodanese-like domain-containing protein [Chloroflexota bacterium]